MHKLVLRMLIDHDFFYDLDNYFRIQTADRKFLPLTFN